MFVSYGLELSDLVEMLGSIAVEVALPVVSVIDPAYRALMVVASTYSAYHDGKNGLLAHRCQDARAMRKAALRVAMAVCTAAAYVFFFRVADIAASAFSLVCNIHQVAYNTVKKQHETTKEAMVNGACDVAALVGDICIGPHHRLAALAVLWLGDLWHAHHAFEHEKRLLTAGYLLKSCARLIARHQVPIEAFRDLRFRLAV